MDYKQFNEKFPLFEKCWKGYKKVGMKDKNGKKVPNCVPIEESDKATPKEVEFHKKLDKLVHDTFGERPDEKKCDKKKSNKDVELNPEIEDAQN